MHPQEPRYGAAFFDHTSRLSQAAARRVVPLLRSMLEVESVVDAGCAQGVWLRAWQEAGVADVRGLDGAWVPRERLHIEQGRFVQTDLSQPFSLERRFDLAQSLEVAEHLPQWRARGFVDDLCRCADAVLFSAAPPGQGGENHVNEQPYGYWRDLFAANGFALFDCLRRPLARERGIPIWYRLNLLLFLNDRGLSRAGERVKAARIPEHAPVPDLSPPLYRLRKALVRTLPSWVQQGLARAKARLAPGAA
jgi:hypothetical protein